MKSGARLVAAAAKSAVCAVTFGGFLGIVAALVIQNLHVGCTVVRSADADSLSCPDGIAYLFPVLNIMSATGLVALFFLLRGHFRQVPVVERERVARSIAAWYGGAMVVLSGLALFLLLKQSADPGPYAVEPSQEAIVIVLILLFGALALLLCQWIGPVVAGVACVIYALALIGAGIHSFIGLPFLLIPAAFLIAAVNLRRP